MKVLEKLNGWKKIIALALYVAGTALELDEAAMQGMLVYIVGQGIADAGKARAAEKAA